MPIKKFALVAGTDVFGFFIVDDDASNNASGPRLAAGLASNPVVIEVDNLSDVSVGWTFDGTTVKAPV